jgi:hypothetical protein
MQPIAALIPTKGILKSCFCFLCSHNPMARVAAKAGWFKSSFFQKRSFEAVPGFELLLSSSLSRVFCAFDNCKRQSVCLPGYLGGQRDGSQRCLPDRLPFWVDPKWKMSGRGLPFSTMEALEGGALGIRRFSV